MESPKKCPIKMGNPSLTPEQWSCEEANCAWWQEPPSHYASHYAISTSIQEPTGQCAAQDKPTIRCTH